MIVQCTVSRDAQVNVLVLEASVDTKVDLWQTAAEDSLVVGIDHTVVVDVLIEAVTNVCSWL